MTSFTTAENLALIRNAIPSPWGLLLGALPSPRTARKHIWGSRRFWWSGQFCLPTGRRPAPRSSPIWLRLSCSVRQTSLSSGLPVRATLQKCLPPRHPSPPPYLHLLHGHRPHRPVAIRSAMCKNLPAVASARSSAASGQLPTEMASTSEKLFECLASRGWKSPLKAMFVQTKTLYYAQQKVMRSRTEIRPREAVHYRISLA